MKKTLGIIIALATTSLMAQPQYKVEKLENGAEITHVVEGHGDYPKESSRVKVHYEGKLENGQVFDSSYDRGAPIKFRLNGVISCWTDGVQKMKVGGKAFLTCPPETAYGKRGAGGIIPPDATLKFQVELIDIVE